MRPEIALASLALFAMTAPGTAYAQAETLQAGAGQAGAGQAGAGQAGVDYAGFVELAGELGEYRQSRLLGWEEWDRQSRLHGAIILDTRSAAAFAQGHIRGAVNLPFSDFTEVSWRRSSLTDSDRCSSTATIISPTMSRPCHSSGWSWHSTFRHSSICMVTATVISPNWAKSWRLMMSTGCRPNLEPNRKGGLPPKTAFPPFNSYED